MAKNKQLSAKEFCEIVLDKKRMLPEEISIKGWKKKHLTKLFGWFETIRSCSHYNHFKIVTSKSKTCEKIEEMKITEKELLSLLSLWELWKQNPSLTYAE
jgi:hypothetical protein